MAAASPAARYLIAVQGPWDQPQRAARYSYSRRARALRSMEFKPSNMK